MNYPKPGILKTSIELEKPRYLSVPQYRKHKIEPSGPGSLFATTEAGGLSQAAKLAIGVAVGLAAVGLVAYMINKKRNR